MTFIQNIEGLYCRRQYECGHRVKVANDKRNKRKCKSIETNTEEYNKSLSEIKKKTSLS